MKKRWMLTVLVLCRIAVVAFADVAAVGIVQDVMGTVTITRNGAQLPSVDIGDPIDNYDLITTGSDGGIVIELSAETGMKGTLVVKPKSVFTIKTEVIRGQPSTEGDILGGSIGVKVKKITGDPKLSVRTSNTVMGVRGTEFDVIVSVNNGILVTCVEGRVACTPDEGEGDELYAVPGSAVARTAGERLRQIPVAVSSIKDFQERWYADEITAFKASAVKVLDQYARSYLRYRDEFRKVSDELAREQVFLKWKNEFRQKIAPSGKDVQVMKEKSIMVKKLMAVRQVLFFFERIYYRLDEVQTYIPQTALRSRLFNGQTVQDFMRQVAAEKM
ncbi:MAG: FecR domain-containing protein, partial [Termitinemataceae bacterium]